MDEERYNKRRPVPFGEYLPMENVFRLLIPALTEISMLERDTQSGEGASLFSFSFGKAGGLICFDSIYPALARESVSEGASLLLLSTNDSWFDGSPAKDIHFAHAVLRAVENGRAVARAANTGISSIISSRGEVLAEIEPLVRGQATATVTLSSRLTLYTRIGDTFVLLAQIFFLLPFGISAVRRIKERIKKEV